ncbi:hypothetical protein ACK350_07115 [Aeromonas veronii]
MIVIPMAGLSSRFFSAGYKIPKYMLPIDNQTVFSRSVKSFEKYFDSDEFVFICRENYNTPEFVHSELKRIGVKNFKISILKEETKGQAETVVLGLRDYREIEDITIFNIDTFRPGFDKPLLAKNSRGYLETFIGEGKNWSNVLPDEFGRVVKTAEKQEISNYCCTGLYSFSYFSDLKNAYNAAKNDRALVHNNEYYIAPLYNYLIKQGYLVNFTIIERRDVIFCGTPDEYSELLKIT